MSQVPAKKRKKKTATASNKSLDFDSHRFPISMTKVRAGCKCESIEPAEVSQVSRLVLTKLKLACVFANRTPRCPSARFHARSSAWLKSGVLVS